MVLAALNYLFHKKQSKYSQNYWSNQTSSISDESVVLSQVKHMPLVISLSRHILDAKWTAGFKMEAKGHLERSRFWVTGSKEFSEQWTKAGAKKP